MRIDFSEYDGQPWFTRDTQMRSGEATKAFGQKLIDKTNCPVAPGSTYGYLDDSTPENLVREDIAVNGVKAYWYRDPVRDSNQPRVLLYIHGGAFLCGNENYARFAGFNVGNKLGLPVLTVEYHLGPEYKMPTYVDDVYNFYNYLRNEKGYAGSDIIVAGDSAGGDLTIALVVRLLARGEELPYKIIPLHPTVDMRMSPDNYRFGLVSHAANVDTDQIFLGGLPEALYDMIVANPGDEDIPEISPICCEDVSGFPPTLLIADDTEVLLSDSLVFGKKLYEAGVDVKLHVFHYMWHDFEVFFPNIPEAEVVWQMMRDFIAK